MKSHEQIETKIESTLHSRRDFFKLGALALATSLSESAFATTWADMAPKRSLSLYNIHTGEQLNTVFWAEGIYQPDALAQINYLLRDYRTGDILQIDTGLLDLLSALSVTLDTNAQFHVISGYRSPATNAMLNKSSHGVAKHSLHMDGLAIDIRMPNRDLSDVHRAALALKGGGVGFYPVLDFVHVDVGRIRTW
ncbi:MAG: DUF882 domain-containing protein [Methylophilaceae bacterium]|nr:DUF882 domain-containing protein [Methylophilaceae bacterium]